MFTLMQPTKRGSSSHKGNQIAETCDLGHSHAVSISMSLTGLINIFHCCINAPVLVHFNSSCKYSVV